MLSGGCYCRAVRYETQAQPFERAACHCSQCRATSGAPLLAWFTVPRSALRLTGEPASFASSAEAERTFCPRCGTQLTFRRHDYGDRIDVTTASLDDPDNASAEPLEQIYLRSRLRWMANLNTLPGQLSEDGAPA